MNILSRLWDAHVVAQELERPAVLYIDLHLVHEVTSPQAFQGLRARHLRVRRPGRTFATMDHSIPTLPKHLAILDTGAAAQLARLLSNCVEFDVPLFAMDSPDRGIVHIIGPELGLTQPGMTIVCGDSHTATHGAFGALAFGIGTSEVEHVLASQCLLQYRPKTYEIRVEGTLQPGVTAKDLILALIARIGVNGGTGHVFEYRGDAIRAMDMEARMTVCNMSIEAGARAGMIAPDDVTFEYLAGRRFAPKGHAFDQAVDRWRMLPSSLDAVFDRSITFDVSRLTPMITYGTNPGMGIPISDPVPLRESFETSAQREAHDKAIRYMNLTPGKPLLGHPVDVVFLGSCTNSRLSDLRQAAVVLSGQRVHPRTRMLVVPGSQAIKKQAEDEGLDQIFRHAGAEWREAGCSMCIAMNGDELEPGQYAVSTSNRNFEGRQGKQGRTFLASPLTAAATAVMGHIADARPMLDAPLAVYERGAAE